MRQIWEFLLANPIMFFILAAWAAGAIGNAIRSKSGQRRAAERKAAQQQAQAPAQPERGAAQEAPSAQTSNAPSGVNEQTRTQAEQLREQQNASRAPGAGNQPGNLVDVTG